MVVLTLLIGLGVAACINANVYHHLPSRAAESAETFALSAFVRGDSDATYAQLVPGLRDTGTADQFGRLIESLHRGERPASVKATHYQPVLGTPTMNIFLEDHSPDEDFHYRLLMEGSASDGYRIMGFWRGNGEYPNPEDRTALASR